jgi:hypothetical protein
MSGVTVTVPAAWFVLFAIIVEVCIQPITVDFRRGALGEFAQIVHQRGEGHAAGSG